MRKIIGIDLDGTLLDSNKEIDQDTIKYVKELRDKNIEVILSSGRHFSEMKGFLRLLDYPSDAYVISSDGQYINSADGNRVWTNEFLKYSDIRYVTSVLKIHSFLAVTEKQNYVICNSFLSYVYQLCKPHSRRNKVKIIDKINNSNNYEKFMFFGSAISQSNKERLEEEYTIHLLQENKKGFEILNKKVSKYQALIKVAELKRVSMDNIMFIGDDYNDVECFKNLKNTVAMENAIDEIKNKASFVTSSNDSKGVLSALREFFD